MRLPRTALLVVALVGGLLAPVSAPAQEAASVAHSLNMEHVANVAYPDANRTATRGGIPDGQGGTDVEFVTLDIGTEASPDVRQFALAGTYENGLQVVDVTDPASPALFSTYECDILQGDVQVFTREDLGGRTFVTYTADLGATRSACTEEETLGLPGGGSSFLGTLIIEITDPSNPVTVGAAPIAAGSHNMTVAPGGEYMYNSDNNDGAVLEVWDITDVTAPVLASTLALSNNAHDVTFGPDGSNRAYVASIEYSYIIDTSDLANPRVVSIIVDPAVTIHHQADPISVDDKTFLVINDETAGAAGNGFCPGGGLHVWDITNELVPVKAGAFFIPEVTVQEGSPTGTGGLVTCTSHVFRAYPEHGILTIAWFSGGVRVLDIAELAGVSAGLNPGLTTGMGMQELGFSRFSNSDAWSAKVFAEDDNGDLYIAANDQTRGFDVFRYSPDVAPDGDGEARGEWLSPQEALARASGLRAQPGYVTPAQPFCTL